MMKKKVLFTAGSALFVFVLMFLLVACGTSAATSDNQASGTSDSQADASSGSQATGTPDAMSQLAEARAGDVVHLGEVSFTDYRGVQFKDDIGWRVLAVEGDRVLLISENVIDLRPYNTERVDITWEQCDLRSWLNGAFYDGLPNGMRDCAGQTAMDMDGKVFLLSTDEAERYFSSDEDRQAGVDLTAEAIRGYNDTFNTDLEAIVRDWGGFAWWLRSSDSAAGSAAVVDSGGRVGYGSIALFGDNVLIGVRPAIWLNL